jgi:hypothetical protein
MPLRKILTAGPDKMKPALGVTVVAYVYVIGAVIANQVTGRIF